jgi:uncharacterized protein (DUF885 family)
MTSNPAVQETLESLDALPFDQFLEDSYRQLGLRDPDTLVNLGMAESYGITNDHFTDLSVAYMQETQRLEAEILARLLEYDRESLSEAQQISYDIYAWFLQTKVDGHAYAYHTYPVNPFSIWGIQNWVFDFMVSRQPINDAQDAEDYIARLEALDTWVEQLIESLQAREAAGIVPPLFFLTESIAQIEDHINRQGSGTYIVKETELYRSFFDRLFAAGDIPQENIQGYLGQAEAAIEETVIPAFVELIEYLTYLETIAPEEPVGMSALPNGDEAYAYFLAMNTNTTMSPEEIHEMGLAEVARIQEEMRTIANAEFGYPLDINMEELFQALIDESENFQGAAVVAEFERILDEINSNLDDYFGIRPETDLEFEENPDSPVAYYRFPAVDGSRPGVFYVPSTGTGLSAFMQNTIYHEGIPGHHFQVALVMELDLPTFRRYEVTHQAFNVFTEGWALYAERLAWEMGLYADNPVGNLGRLYYELDRAARLVVDTGVNAMGWTLDEGSQYFLEETGRWHSPIQMVRYYIYPGQACGFTIGFSKMLELRQQAMDGLGDRFDLVEFHDLILGSGPLPLEMLEQMVGEWIAIVGSR